ncbi:RHS repeat-associated core domain-containing protein [Bacillus sp. DJP31]|uniref:RHS repeat-associated core domain-containing protein n=1 Tax=Bacillus sp. DJP31 TaxID=3409789 RepID=UPI003BB52C38
MVIFTTRRQIIIICLKARYYTPDTGRFLTRDVIPLMNLYSYAEGNPVRFINIFHLHTKFAQ